MAKFSRHDILKRLSEKVAQDALIVFGEIEARAASQTKENHEWDIFGIHDAKQFDYASGVFSDTISVGNNHLDAVFKNAPDIVPGFENTPCIAGFTVQGSLNLWDHWLSHLSSIGVSGFMNFPSAGLVNAKRKYRQDLEDAGQGFDKEVTLLKSASQMGCFTIGYCFSPEEAVKMAEAGADVLVCHTDPIRDGGMDKTPAGDIAHHIEVTNSLISAARTVRRGDDFFPLVHLGRAQDSKMAHAVATDTDAIGFVEQA